MLQVLGRSAHPGPLPALHPGVGTGPLLHGWGQAEPLQAPLFQLHALASEMPSKEPIVSLSTRLPLTHLNPSRGTGSHHPSSTTTNPLLRGLLSQPTREHLPMEPQPLPIALPERQVTCSERKKEKERQKKKKPNTSPYYFFFSFVAQNFSRQRRARAPAVPMSSAGPRTTHPGVVRVGEG